jgi:hypothetical protein
MQKLDITTSELYQVLDIWLSEQDFGNVHRIMKKENEKRVKKKKNTIGHCVFWLNPDKNSVFTNWDETKGRCFKLEDPDFFKKFGTYYKRHISHCHTCKGIVRAAKLV